MIRYDNPDDREGEKTTVYLRLDHSIHATEHLREWISDRSFNSLGFLSRFKKEDGEWKQLMFSGELETLTDEKGQWLEKVYIDLMKEGRYLEA